MPFGSEKEQKGKQMKSKSKLWRKGTQIQGTPELQKCKTTALLVGGMQSEQRGKWNKHNKRCHHGDTNQIGDPTEGQQEHPRNKHHLAKKEVSKVLSHGWEH